MFGFILLLNDIETVGPVQGQIPASLYHCEHCCPPNSSPLVRMSKACRLHPTLAFPKFPALVLEWSSVPLITSTIVSIPAVCFAACPSLSGAAIKELNSVTGQSSSDQGGNYSIVLWNARTPNYPKVWNFFACPHDYDIF